MILASLSRHATGRNVIIAMVLWIAYAALLFSAGPYSSLQRSVGESLLEEKFGYSPAVVSGILDRVGESGRSQYRLLQWLDLINAMLTAIAFALLLAFLLKRGFTAASPLHYLAWLPIAGGVMEFFENGFIYTLLNYYPTISTTIVGVAATATSIKLGMGIGTMIVIVVSIIVLLVRRLSGGRQSM